MPLTHLSNEEVLASLRTLLGDANRLIAKVIAYLVEVEDRRLHLDMACSSMFDFCTRKMGMSEDEACRRIAVARLVREFPQLLDGIGSGRLHLSNVLLLRDLFTMENVDELAAAAAGRTKREVQELIARLAPKPDVPSLIRKLPESAGPNIPSPTVSASSLQMPMAVGTSPASQIEALSPARYKVQLTASTQLRDKLEHARELMRHRNPSGDLAAIVDRALDVLIERLEREKLGKAKRPRTPRAASSKPQHITRAARREVFERDGCQCSFVSHDGERCPARGFLELDHKTPRALGGTGDASNARVLCRAHNGYAAERVFGRQHVARKIEARTLQRGSSPSRSRAPSAAPVETAESPAAVRDRVGAALVAMGFRPQEAHRAIAAIDPATLGRPIEVLLREALAST